MTSTPGAAGHDVARAAAELFGARLCLAETFASRLTSRGTILGLIGPREVDRLWERHLLNCALLTDLIEPGVSVVDIGSGAGFPGLVMAIRRPDLRITLIESMGRRAAWLRETTESLGLGNVELRHGRAEQFAGRVSAEVVTARAVAPLERLLGWAWPLCRPGGRILAVKGNRAETEIEEASGWLHRATATDVRIEELGPLGAPWAARVVVIRRSGRSESRGRHGDGSPRAARRAAPRSSQ